MTAYTAMLAGRRAAERLMVDACTIVRQGAAVTNPDTGEVTYPGIRTIYTGKCKLKLPQPTARPNEVGGAQVFMQHPVLSLPATTSGVQIDDLVTITASLLPALVGRSFHVRASPAATYETAARFEVMEVLG